MARWDHDDIYGEGVLAFGEFQLSIVAFTEVILYFSYDIHFASRMRQYLCTLVKMDKVTPAHFQTVLRLRQFCHNRWDHFFDLHLHESLISVGCHYADEMKVRLRICARAPHHYDPLRSADDRLFTRIKTDFF